MLRRTQHLMVLCFTIVFALQCSYADTPSKCALSGKIIGPRASRFSVKLKPAGKNPLDLYDGYSAAVAADGGFHFEDINPGTYVLVAEGAGFMPTEFGAAGPQQPGRPIELRTGQHRRGIVLTPVQKHVVCGKVTDDRGNPLSKVEVYAFAHRKGSSWLTFDDADHMRTSTDADGNYRLPDLLPGEYFIQAGMYTWFFGSKNRTQQQAENFANAEPVEVGPDAGTECRENILTGARLSWTSHRIRGTITDDPALAGKDLVLTLLEVSRTGAAHPWPYETFDPGRSFDVSAPPPGPYRMILARGRFPQNWGDGPPPEFHILASQDINLGDRDMDGITMKVDPLASLSGRVKLESITPLAMCPTQEKLHISIQKDDDGQFLETELTADGDFTFSDVPLGGYKVHLYPVLRGSTFVKSTHFDGQTTEGREIRVSSPGSHTLEMVLSGRLTGALGHTTPDEHIERYETEWSHPKASLFGQVRNIIPGNPPWVKLWAVRFNSERSYEYSTKPNANGDFHFDGIDPGIYLLLTQGSGYAISEYGASHPGLEGTTITLKARQYIEGLKLTSYPKEPSICGKVTDERGRALPNLAVVASPSLKQADGLTFSSINEATNSNTRSSEAVEVVSAAAPSVQTDSEGNFRFLDLKPGRYFLWAESLTHEESSSGGEWVQRWTYFPASPTLAGAQPIDFRFAPDTECRHDIQMRGSSEFHLRGKLAGLIPDGFGNDHFDVSLVETNAAGANGRNQYRPIEKDGAFDFPKVRSGLYRLAITGYKGELPTVCSGQCGPTRHFLGSREIIVENRDLNGVAIEPNPPVLLKGEIRFENLPKEWRAFRVDAQNVSLSNDSFSSLMGIGTDLRPQRVQVHPDGSFALENLDGGTYKVDVELTHIMGDEFYVKSMLLNGRPVEGKHITLKPDQAATISILVSNGGGEVDATVNAAVPAPEEYRYDEPCRPRMPVTPHVLLIPDSMPKDGTGIMSGSFTSAGQVEITGVPPGRYYAVAYENFSSHFTLSPSEDSLWQNSAFLQSVKALGAPVEVAAGQKIKLSLQSATAQIQNLLARYQEDINIEDHCAASCSYEGFWNGESAEAQK